jgi:hypothetical protein
MNESRKIILSFTLKDSNGFLGTFVFDKSMIFTLLKYSLKRGKIKIMVTPYCEGDMRSVDFIYYKTK